MSKLQLSSNNSDSTLTLFTCTDIPFNNLLEQVEVATFVYPNTWKCWTKGAFWLSTRQISEEWNLNNMRIRHILIWKCYILSIWAGSCRIDINIFKSVATVHHDDCDTFCFFSKQHANSPESSHRVLSRINNHLNKWAFCFCCHVLRD